LWYAYEGDWSNWHTLTVEQANTIIKANSKKEPVNSLEEYAVELQQEETPDYHNVVGQDSLTRFDSKGSGKKKRKNKRKKKKPQKNG